MIVTQRISTIASRVKVAIMDYSKARDFVIILAVLFPIAASGTVKHSSTVPQCPDLPQDTLEAKGYMLVAGKDECYIYPKDAAQVHETKLLMSDDSLGACSPNEHMHRNGSKCICDRGWYKDSGTLQCSQCTKCCPGAVRVIAACVEQDLVDDICALAKPCFYPGPTQAPPKSLIEQWNEWKPYNYVVYAALGAILFAVIAGVIIYRNRHAIKRVLPYPRKCNTQETHRIIDEEEQQEDQEQQGQ